MDNLETINPPAKTATDVQNQCAGLQRQLTILLIGAVIISATFSVFLYCQARFAYVDLETTKANVGPGLQQYKQHEKPAIDRLEGQLSDYARTHPDFTRLLATYRIQLAPVAAAPTAPAANAAPAPAKPAPAAPQKK